MNELLVDVVTPINKREPIIKAYNLLDARVAPVAAFNFPKFFK
jgi:hypothetical protein